MDLLRALLSLGYFFAHTYGLVASLDGRPHARGARGHTESLRGACKVTRRVWFELRSSGRTQSSCGRPLRQVTPRGPPLVKRDSVVIVNEGMCCGDGGRHGVQLAGSCLIHAELPLW